MQKREDHNISQKKTMENIQLVGCGEFYHDVLQLGVLDDINITKVVLTANFGLTSLKACADSQFLEIPHVLGDLSPEITEEAVLKRLSVKNYFNDVELLFLTCEIGLNPCMGYIYIYIYISALASVARNQGVFVIAVAPINWGINYWRENEKLWISKLEKNTDMLISVPFNRLTEATQNYPVKERYNLLVRVVATVIKNMTNHVQGEGSVESIGFLNHPCFLDDATLKLIKGCSHASVGFGVGKGEEAFLDSAENAMKCPLLTFDLKEARLVIVTISGDVCLYEAETIAQNVAIAAHVETSTIWDVFLEDENGGEVQTLIIALK